MTKNKILPIDELAHKLKALRETKKIVLCHGVFDLLHIGHMRYLKQSKKFGDILVVTVTPDKYVNKGPHRPAFNENLRAEALASLEYVDYVAINKWPTAVETIKLLKPHIYSKGSEYKELDKDTTGAIIKEKTAIEDIGGEIVFIEDITFSSSSLLNRYFSVFTPNIREYLDNLCIKYSTEDIINYIYSLNKLKALVIGETIIDEYHYCETLGKSGKEPILAARYVEEEKFAGGTLAIANHISSFVDKVSLVSFLGEDNSHIEFIKKSLSHKICTRFLYHHGPTIVKRRYVEKYPFQKLFEIYFMNNCEETSEKRLAFSKVLEEELDKHDVVIVADYGHGMMDRENRIKVCEKAKFLAVNVQVNAGNIGFNTISRYPRADLVCISEKELRFEMRSRTRNIKELVQELTNQFDYKYIVITRGELGCLAYSPEDGFVEVPAFINKFKDRVGAGDAVLSIVSLALAAQIPLDISVFLGNCAGAQTVTTICNSVPIERASLIKYVTSLLK